MDIVLYQLSSITGIFTTIFLSSVFGYFYFLRSRKEVRIPLVPLHEQACILEGPEQVHVSRFYKEARNGKFLTTIHDDVQTLYQSFRHGSLSSNNGNCLGWRDSLNSSYQWMNYNEALLRAKNFGSGLIELGLKPRKFVGIYSQNRPEWVLTEQGCYCYSLVLVPLYDTLGPDACAFIIDQTESQIVIVEDDKKVNLILDKSTKHLKKIIAIKELRPSTVQRAKNQGINVWMFDEVEKIGALKNHVEEPPQPDDLSTICYTSGTTGAPKGVMLSHKNVLACIVSVCMQLGEQKLRATDVMLSFLPLAHMLERACENACFYVGASVGYYSGDIKNLTIDLKALKPTIIPAVPRLLNRVYDKINNEVRNSAIKRLLFRMALSSKENELRKGIIRNNSFWDKIVFKKVQEGFGGNLRLMVVGSAPLAGNVLTFMRCSLGCLIVEGYGQTECVAAVSLTVQGDFVPDHVGPPIACCGIKLVDVPEMEYYQSNQQGEICVKGSCVFRGYFKDPARTNETIDTHGWHHTGDIGQWLPNGTLKIIDRKKHIFKLSQGEYIVPEKIENIYLKCKYVEQVFVHGESLKSCIIAIVVPDVESVKCWAVENGIAGTLSILCNNPEVKSLIFNDMTELGKQYGLKSFEQVKDIYLHPDQFSVQNQLLTPTYKSRRPQIRNYFKPQLDDMYKLLD